VRDDPAFLPMAGLQRFSDLDQLRTDKFPLLIHIPGLEQGRKQDVTGGQIDLAPTLLHLLGITESRDVMFGKNLLDGRDSLVVFRDGSFTNGTDTFVARGTRFEQGRAYDLRTGRTVDDWARLAHIRDLFQKARARLAALRLGSLWKPDSGICPLTPVRPGECQHALDGALCGNSGKRRLCLQE
jgi:phosphoglycerol transferase MdoB-like AlkP superfamily enzyme